MQPPHPPDVDSDKIHWRKKVVSADEHSEVGDQYILQDNR